MEKAKTVNQNKAEGFEVHRHPDNKERQKKQVAEDFDMRTYHTVSRFGYACSSGRSYRVYLLTAQQPE